VSRSVSVVGRLGERYRTPRRSTAVVHRAIAAHAKKHAASLIKG